MSIYVNNTYRVKRNADQQESMLKLISAKIFGQYKDIIMVSAVIGYNFGAFEPIEKTASDGILMQFFNQKDYDIIDLIAYAHKREQSIIKSDEKYEILASYANGGYPILLNKLGVNVDDEITSDEAKKISMRYYMLLVSNGFCMSDISDEELLK